MVETFLIALCSLLIALYLQARHAARQIRRNRSRKTNAQPQSLILETPVHTPNCARIDGYTKGTTPTLRQQALSRRLLRPQLRQHGAMLPDPRPGAAPTRSAAPGRDGRFPGQ